jgi:hypothetical protein
VSFEEFDSLIPNKLIELVLAGSLGVAEPQRLENLCAPFVSYFA